MLKKTEIAKRLSGEMVWPLRRRDTEGKKQRSEARGQRAKGGGRRSKADTIKS
jgi:hypothetical protein